MEQTKGIRKFIGDRVFYKLALGVMLPIIAQNLITSFVSLLDNIMVGQCGTAAMSGVAVVGQLMFNYMVIIFGTVAGPASSARSISARRTRAACARRFAAS